MVVDLQRWEASRSTIVKAVIVQICGVTGLHLGGGKGSGNNGEGIWVQEARGAFESSLLNELL